MPMEQIVLVISGFSIILALIAFLFGVLKSFSNVKALSEILDTMREITVSLKIQNEKDIVHFKQGDTDHGLLRTWDSKLKDIDSGISVVSQQNQETHQKLELMLAR
jgi:hypothetical protein